MVQPLPSTVSSSVPKAAKISKKPPSTPAKGAVKQ